jgi:uncharacterized protein (TIGR03435 family)
LASVKACKEDAGPGFRGGRGIFLAGAIGSRLSDLASADHQGVAREVLNGPMLQALLEDRFQLRLHREMREAPVYEISIAKGGSRRLDFSQAPATRSIGRSP